MIILTVAQATRVRGRSPSNGNAALWPVPLKDGTFMLPEAVLTDPAHSDVWAFLAALPKATVLASNMYSTSIADQNAVELRNIPSLSSTGTRT